MRERLALFALVTVHPQLITYGLYISNDTLTILLGTLVMWQFWRWLETPSDARLRWLALCCALGLLTKATFLAIVPVVAVYVLAVAKRIDRSTMWRRVGEFLAIAIVVGCYKYVENYWHFGTPFVSNLDAGYSWIADQTRGRTMPWAYVGFDPLRLLRHPLGNERRPYLEMLYETFWYEYLPMSNLATARRWPYYFTGSAVLVAALVPTLVMVVGAIKAFTSMWAPLTASRPPSRLDRINIVRYLSISVGVAVLALLVVE
jgi:4-amino-4-deoxy-L-arabinose transferase-like glycosyltransferase